MWYITTTLQIILRINQYCIFMPKKCLQQQCKFEVLHTLSFIWLKNSELRALQARLLAVIHHFTATVNFPLQVNFCPQVIFHICLWCYCWRYPSINFEVLRLQVRFRFSLTRISANTLNSLLDFIFAHFRNHCGAVNWFFHPLPQVKGFTSIKWNLQGFSKNS